jgi:hypothetical protein
MRNESTVPDENSLSRLHYELIRGLIERSACPANSELASQLGASTPQIEEFLRGLADIHGLVLHPHVCEPWVVHPFSVTPTLNWVEGRGRGWWAPCIWCAFGVATLVGGDVRIHTRLGGEAEVLTIPTRNGLPLGLEEVWVHFAIPPVRAWQNVHQHCAMVLAFSSREEIREWCERYRLRREKRFAWRKSPGLLSSGTAAMRIEIGASGLWRKRKVCSTRQDCDRLSGNLTPEMANTNAALG